MAFHSVEYSSVSKKSTFPIKVNVIKIINSKPMKIEIALVIKEIILSNGPSILVNRKLSISLIQIRPPIAENVYLGSILGNGLRCLIEYKESIGVY